MHAITHNIDYLYSITPLPEVAYLQLITQRCERNDMRDRDPEMQQRTRGSSGGRIFVLTK